MRQLILLAAPLFALVLAPLGVFAQQVSSGAISGRVSAPQVCPSNPDLIAYERVEGSVQTLHIYDRRTGRSMRVSSDARDDNQAADPFGGLFRDADASALQRFEGQLTWRPGLDSKGRHWFAYIATGDMGLDLYLSYVDADGRVAPEPLLLALADQQFHPAWSPETGNHLVFISGGSGRTDLFYVPNVSTVLNTDGGADFDPRPLTRGSELKFSPSWSPDETAIAFEMVAAEGGVVNRGIHLVYFEDALQNAVQQPIALSAELNNYDEYQPSWSPNGELIAFYVTQARLDEGSENQLQDIGLLNVVRSSQNNRIVRGNQVRGWAPRLVQNVIPHTHGGPVWVDAGSNIRILYVKRDAQAGFPIHLADITRWQQLDAGYDQPLDHGSGTTNHLDVSNTRIPGGMRIAFVGQVGSANEIRTYDVLWAGADRNPTVPTDAVSSKTALTRSLVFPGWGQLMKGEKRKGMIFIGAGAAALSVAAGAFLLADPKIADSDAAEDAYREALQEHVAGLATWGPLGTEVPHTLELEALHDEWQDKYNATKSLRTVFYSAVGVAAAVWAASLIDVTQGSGGAGRRPVRIAGNHFNLSRPYPRVTLTDGRVSYGVGVNISIK